MEHSSSNLGWWDSVLKLFGFIQILNVEIWENQVLVAGNICWLYCTCHPNEKDWTESECAQSQIHLRQSHTDQLWVEGVLAWERSCPLMVITISQLSPLSTVSREKTPGGLLMYAVEECRKTQLSVCTSLCLMISGFTPHSLQTQRHKQ